MSRLLPILLSLLIVGLFLYSKLLPYKDKLNPQYKKIFDFFNSIFTPIFNFLKNLVKPFQVGIGLSVDMSQIVLLIIFLTVVLISGFIFVEYLANNGYLNSKQYRFYCVVIFIGFLFLCGLLENYCNIKNGY